MMKILLSVKYLGNKYFGWEMQININNVVNRKINERTKSQPKSSNKIELEKYMSYKFISTGI